MTRTMVLAISCLAFAVSGLAASKETLAEFMQEAAKLEAKFEANLKNKFVKGSNRSAAHHDSPNPYANQLSKWKFLDVASQPARTDPINWGTVRDMKKVVKSINWATTSTPSLEGLQPGMSDAPDGTGKAYGKAGLSYSDSRFGTGYWNAAKPSGRLLFTIGTSTYSCSATLIGKSLLLTAAHCVFNYGTNAGSGFYTNFRFYPQLSGSTAPFGFWRGRSVMVPGVQYRGTDTCTARGIACNNDLALIWLQPTGSSISQQAGVALGYYSYAWNGYSFSTPASGFQSIFGNKPSVAITQLGYPGSYDQGTQMQLSTSNGFKYADSATGNGRQMLNLVRGSSLEGGSSGGPWVTNFGVNPASTTVSGSAAGRNRIVGVTSWGYSDNAVKFTAASWFGQNAEFTQSAYGTRGAGNIGKIIYDACDNTAISGWQLQSKGFCR